MLAWDNFLKNQKKILGDETFGKWLKPLKIITFDSCNLYLEATDPIQITWFEEHIRPIIKNALFNSNYKKIKVHLRLKNNLEKKNEKEKKLFFSIKESSLLKENSMDSFYVSKKNKIPFSLVQEIISIKEPSFNPIFLYGPPGAGKTHILMGLSSLLKKKKKKVFFVKAQTFTNHVVTAIRKGMIQKFREIYRNQDFLIIDDIHIFSNKIATQEEFFHTFNTLHLNKTQIILSANVPPNRLKNIEARLISRFEWGIVLKLERIEKEEMVFLLDQKLNDYSINLLKDAKKFMLEIFSHPHDMQKALQAILLRLSENVKISKDILKEVLSDLIEKQKTLSLTFDKIIDIVSKFYGITSLDILGKSQTKECSLPRQISMYFCRKKLSMTYKKIAELFQRDHSTVISNVQNIEKNEKKFFSMIQDISKDMEDISYDV